MAVDACSPDHRPSCAAASSRAMCLSSILSAAGTFAALYSASNSRTYGSTNASSSSANSQSALKLSTGVVRKTTPVERGGGVRTLHARW